MYTMSTTNVLSC